MNPLTRYRLTATALAIGLVAAGLVASVPAAAQATPRNAEMTANGAWCWFQDPRAVHYHGTYDRTYVGYVTSTGDIDVVSQNAGTATLVHTTLHAAFQADDHAAPGLVVLPDGRIAVFYSGHAGPHMYYRISVRPEDVSAFGPEQSVPTNTAGAVGYTYGNPIYLSAERRLYLFFRGGDAHPSMTWTTDYVHWASAVDVVIPDLPPTYTRPYVKYATNGLDTIALTFTDGHPSEPYPTNIYELIYKGGVLRTPNGTAVSVLDPAAQPAPDPTIPHTGGVHTGWLQSGTDGALIYRDPGNAPGWPESMALDSGGAPVVLYATYQNFAHALYRYTRWNGAAWTTPPPVDAGGPMENSAASQYSGGADIVQNNPASVYLSRETTPGSRDWELEHWTATGGGTRFTRDAQLTHNPAAKNVRPVVPWGPPGDIQVLWMSGRYDYYYANGYHTQLRELTSTVAPATARISVSATAVIAGSTVQITARALQGYQGTYLPSPAMHLLGHTPGRPGQVLQAKTADRFGLATFTVRATATTQYTISVAPGAGFGAVSTAPVTVTVYPWATARISVTPATVRRGQAVTVGLRALDGLTGRYLPRATVELWQHSAGQPWQRVAGYTTDTAGLVRVTRRPTATVVYRARVAATPTRLAGTSPALTVQVR